MIKSVAINSNGNGKSSTNKRSVNGRSFKNGFTNVEGRVDMLDIDGLMRSLANTRKVFHSEADFQHALAWHIHQAMPESQVRLEVDVMQVEHQRRFLDIWLPLEGTAIELKYKTRELEMGQDDESFVLRNQSAQAQGRYDFLRDIQRLEHMHSKLEQCKAGYSVLLTNDSSYWKVPTHRDLVDADFRVHEGRAISGALAWAASARPGTVRGREAPIQLRGPYRLRWQEYSNFPGKPYGRFQYLAVAAE